MTSLYKRAGARQRRILRIVEGSVKNALDAHPGASLPHNFARSVAKRAAGTLTAAWPDVLAVSEPSERGGSNCPEGRRAGAEAAKRPRRGGRQVSAPSPLRELHNRLGVMAGWARKAGHEQRAAAFADALRVVASLGRRP